MNTDIAIELKDVTIKYRSYKGRPASLKESLIKFVKTGEIFQHATFNALENLSLKVERGTSLGIIGSNGAGKSTLLRVIAGVLPPTSGTITAHGSLDCLIQLGAGFDT